jgi:hypothetical protein
LPVFLCHRSPGQVLVGRTPADAGQSLAAGLPRRAGRRYLSVSPMPLQDGGLELLTADGALATRLQRAVRKLAMEFRLRVRGEITPQQEQGVLGGELDRGARVAVERLEAAGGEGANRWYSYRDQRVAATCGNARAAGGRAESRAARPPRHTGAGAQPRARPLARDDRGGTGRSAAARYWQRSRRPVTPRLAGPSSQR